MALETLLSIPPLDLYIKEMAFDASVNIRLNGWWLSSPEVGHQVIRNLITVDELMMPSDEIKAVFMLDDGFEREREDWTGDGKIYPPSEGTVCYTDGSKRNGLSGAGYYCESPLMEVSISTGEYATVFQTELHAISELCISEPMKLSVGRVIYICTDSQSVMDAVSSPLVKSRTVYNCKSRLNELSVANKVTLLWAPAHPGIPGNVRADELARNGIEKRFIG